jgi:PTS system mannose-specific IIA component
MFGILIVTHGQMANGITDAARMILGEPEDKDTHIVESVVLKEGESPEALTDDINDKILRIMRSGAKGVLILTDLYGSSTTNAGVKTMLGKKDAEKTSQRSEIAVVSGINLPMLLELIPALRSSKSIDDLAKLAVDSGRKNIINVEDELAKRKKK